MKLSTSVTMIVSWFLLIGWPSTIAEVKLDSGCLKPEPPEHGEMFVLWSGLLVQFRCQSAEYKLVGAAAVICRNRTWTQDPPVCVHQHQLQLHLQQQQSIDDDDSSEVAEMSETVDDELDGMDDVQFNGANPALSMMVAADEDPVSRGKKKNGGGNKGNKKDDKKEDKKKAAKQSTKEPKKEDKKPKNPSSSNPSGEKKNKGKKSNDNKHSSAKASTLTEARNVNEVESTDGAEESNQNSPVDFATLDQSCLVDADNSNSPIVPAPAIPHGSGIKYIRKRNKGPGGGNRYAAAVFQCSVGYQFVVPDADRLYCRQGRWVGPSPICIIPNTDHPDQDASSVSNNALTEREEESSNAGSYGNERSECGDDKGGCEQICDDTSGTATCLCYRGYVLAQDGTTCTDVDECTIDNGGCEGTCVNRQGSYQCFCSSGFRLASNGKKCIDHNECLLRNGHGPCQGTCRNTHGSYECSCDERPGTQLAADGHTCEDLDECSLGDNFGCSHTCLNTLGTAFCTCPDGYMLGDDWKTCEDMDECELEDVGQACAGTCINTIGSFRCSEEDGASSQEDGENGENEDNEDNEEEEAEAIQEAIPSTTTPSTTTTTTTTPTPTSTTATPTTTPAPTTTIGTTTTTSTTTTTTTTETPVIADVVPVEEEDEEDEDPEEDGTEEEGEEGDEEEPEELEDRANRIDNSLTTTTTVAPDIKEEKSFELDQTCPEGFQLADRLAEVEDGSACLDVDECETQDNFGCSHLCINTQGSAHCDCPSGWNLSNDGKACLDLDECSDNNFGCSHRCINTEGSAYCACPSGYVLDISNNKTCSDIDECSDQDLPNFGCSHHCINLPGSAECKCTAGYKLRADQKTCKDIDECAKENGGCSHECVNLKGGMRCECPEGYRLSETDAKTCQDIDECESVDQEAGHSCRATGGTCRNTLGSYECICPEGFRTTGTACADIDECAELSPCSTACTNLQGSYRCDCDDGFENINGTCTDIDECPNGVCDQLCTNIPGSYICDCHPGYQLIGDVCIDIDECATTSPCDGICRNTVGSFECLCAEGFQINNNDQCVDTDECLNEPCEGICINTQGSYSCSCELGYQLGDNGTCSDIDECLNNPCPVECINSPGSYTCLCPFGYEFDDNVCKDVDECQKQPCGNLAKCINTEGSFTCQCEPGYILRGNDCEDVDECKENPCNGICINLPGSYKCICDPGYELRNGRCEDIDECLNYKCGGRCTNLPGTYRCDCESGYKLEGERCVDIDECQTLKPCKGSCVNLPGSYRCDCEAGYRSEGNACIDIDECSHRNGGCSHICVNTIGSFRCTCNSGFDVSHKNQSNCVDVNECRSNNGGCSQDCINTRGAYHCTCSDQYYLETDGRTCTELPPRCPKMKAPDHGEIECIQNLNHTQHRSREQEDEALIAENGRGDLGASGWSANRSPKSRSLYNSGSTCNVRCNKGYKLVGDFTVSCGRSGLWLGEPATCIPLACPKLLAPDSGVLMPHTCSTGKTFAGQQCQVRCRAGYRLIGGGIYHCLPSQQWRSPDEPARCERIDSPVPFIQCPGNMAVNLPAQQKRAYVTFSQPKSNMDWFRYVDSDPLWAKQLGGELPVGLNTITFRVRSPVSDLTATCNFTIEIFDKEIPRMTNCPTSWTVFLEPGQSSQIVTWNEPIFTDNIEIVQLNKSREPGELFQAGYHEIAYVAQDGAGNQAKCQFTIHVTSQTVHRDTSSPITKLPRGRVLVRCPGSKPGKYVEMYTYKVPAGCIVINNPSAYTRATVTTLAPRYTVFDWNFGASSDSEGGDGRDSANTGRHPASHNKLVDGVPRLRDAGAPSSPVIVPGPALIPSMGSQPVRLGNGNGRARKSRINEADLQLLPNVPSGSNDPVHQPGRGNKNRNRDKKRGGVVDLLLPFTANDAVLQSTTTIRSGRKRQQGPKHQPKLVPGPSFVPGKERNRKQKEKKEKNASASGATPNNRKNKTTTS
uniref:Putative Fibrillin-2 n=1 Tax=Daphnia magna TaxID=35525 RepID=A0A0P6DBK5_9CRUS